MINKKLLKSINKSGVGSFVADTDHNTLLNRNLKEQHSISSITDLQTTLDAKQAKLTAGTGIDITDDVISATGDVTLDTAQTITGAKTFNANVEIDGQKYLYFGDTNKHIRNSGSSLELATIDDKPVDFYTNSTKRMSISSASIDAYNLKFTNVGTPTTDKDATTKKYVDDGLTLKANQTDVVDLSSTQAVRGNKTFMNACYVNTTPTNGKGITNKEYVDTAITGIDLSSKADKLVVPVNASIDTSTTINDRVVKVVYKEYTSAGDSVVASTSAGFGYLNASIIRKKSNNSWGIVSNDEFNEVYVNGSNQIRFNIKTLGGYTNEIKLTIQHN